MVYPHVQYDGPAHPEGLHPVGPAMARELDSRTSDGIEVRLLWYERDGRVLVAVNDTKTGETFEVPVPDSGRALDVFHHPYAYPPRRERAGEPSLAA